MSKQKRPPRWRKKPNTGTHYLPNGKRLGDRGIIRCWESELKGARDKFELIDPSPDAEPPTPEATLKVKKRDEGGYDVVNEKDEAINDAELSAGEAESLVNGEETKTSERDGDEKPPARDVVKDEMLAMIASGRNLTMDGKPELPTLKARVKNIRHRVDITVTDELRDMLFAEIQREKMENASSVAGE
jgi:hypothetical protein